eukprot:CAMPEP_0201577102 /NCGR_PEP_ID=MMETSP0190_2-20130828/23328_1 /ASSEMBLY_ACC=CAM_ASM_000263 /TAXON_ID=37353 /ORGANISM="Rosalina sp." /LENGTH=60 /DNA_ID=CAMNT_0048008779 /DNA_START=9 /DNA_END=192 /DNA_ORIENTATION=-
MNIDRFLVISLDDDQLLDVAIELAADLFVGAFKDPAKPIAAGCDAFATNGASIDSSTPSK